MSSRPRAFLHPAASQTVTPPLDPQQDAVLRMLGLGHSIEDIALVLDIRPRDVVMHKYRIMELLELRNDSGLLAFAVSRGLLPSSPGPAMTKEGPRQRAPRRTLSYRLHSWLQRSPRIRAHVDEDAPTAEFHRSFGG
ncbi:MAG: helix-turn-helix transcriptional regulator [Myxococcales bacterium]|nr:helix-turn-helix transcriptional regulator [Myxococcales bacterium]MCB9713850.1 helix-turn-helix transcriptional regulator [Myxococcales bacterium]